MNKQILEEIFLLQSSGQLVDVRIRNKVHPNGDTIPTTVGTVNESVPITFFGGADNANKDQDSGKAVLSMATELPSTNKGIGGTDSCVHIDDVNKDQGSVFKSTVKTDFRVENMLKQEDKMINIVNQREKFLVSLKQVTLFLI